MPASPSAEANARCRNSTRLDIGVSRVSTSTDTRAAASEATTCSSFVPWYPIVKSVADMRGV